jgi:tetratricopeptide (TPR) repeat protein
MQAHLAMRIGKWQHTTDWSSKAVDLEKAYHQFLDVKPADDHQFNHHLLTLTKSLVHDGRFAEARRVQAEAVGYGYHFRPEWFGMALAAHDWAGAQKVVDHFRKTDKPTAAYYAALLALEQGDSGRAAAEVDVLRQAVPSRKADKFLERRLWEAQGRLMCRTGQGEAGCRLLKRAVDKTKDDYQHHAWAGGAYYMEAWGVGALEAGRAADAEEAFQEALAHDSGSVQGALGMWALCGRLGRAEEAERYLKVARRCWARADPQDFERRREDFARMALNVTGAATVAAGGE